MVELVFIVIIVIIVFLFIVYYFFRPIEKNEIVKGKVLQKKKFKPKHHKVRGEVQVIKSKNEIYLAFKNFYLAKHKLNYVVDHINLTFFLPFIFINVLGFISAVRSCLMGEPHCGRNYIL